MFLKDSMAQSMRNMLEANTTKFKRSLDRIAEKYSKLKDEDDMLEVDINQIGLKTLSKYLAQSRDHLEKSAAKSQLDVSDCSLNTSITAHSQLNLSCNADEVKDSSEHANEDSAEGALRSLDETWRNPSESELLPEDQDEELQMSLSSRSNSLAELYPTMVSRIERAWHRQTVFTAASSVLRRYRRWRQQSRRLNTTFDITARPNDSHLKPSASKRLLREDSGRPAERMWTETIPRPRPVPLTLASLRNERQSPGRERGLLTGDTPRPIRVMDFSDTAKPQEMSLNEAFTVSEYSPRKQTNLADQIPISASPTPFSSAKSSPDPSFRLRRLSVSSDRAEVSVADTLSVPERPDICRTPVHHSPFKTRTASALSRSPLAFSRRKYYEDWPREPMKIRSCSTSMSPPSKRPVVLVKMVDPQDSTQSPHQRPSLPLPARAETSHRGFRRNLSYDSSLPRHAYQPPKKVEEDYLRVYHKFVCLNKSAPFDALPCRQCGRSSEAGRTASFTSLAALALSPHRSILRKRHREQRCDGHPQSKRLRYENYAYSPGSKRHSDEMLRRCQSSLPSAVPYSPSKHRSQESTAYLEAWMDRHERLFSSPGGRLENDACDGFSPRNWR
ncbi:uncharacterized protein LOC103137102 isoform X1 [Poecilia formosa]|uniref:uncharacterized protein LOC103137102 isoform X1 n=1 Tax=Poecilia formosa TaxID=48698 RepID=UPI000443E0E9|nr:PREDICTED: uncharacterized protein LOC103137102 isoform X1 [Poecilia formosa]